MAERDPDIVIRWLSDRIDSSSVPDRTVVMDLDVTGTGARRFWLVLERGTAPSVCIEDPSLAGDPVRLRRGRRPGAVPDCPGDARLVGGDRRWFGAAVRRAGACEGLANLVRPGERQQARQEIGRRSARSTR
jgi:hypothetical protein